MLPINFILNNDKINPFNPFQLNTEFKINVIDEAQFMEMKDEMLKQYPKLPLDKEMIVFEGCERDDNIILGGKNAFLSHFCTLFNFNVCLGFKKE